MVDAYMERFMELVDPAIVQTQVVDVLNEDADLAEQVEACLERAFLKELEKPAFTRQAEASSEKYAALLHAQRESRLHIDDKGAARATWLTVQVETDKEVVLHVGVG